MPSRPRAPQHSPDAADWFREHFNEDYLVLYARRDREAALREARFLVDRLAIRDRDRVLDLCCGHGRHLEALRREGIVATGVDLSEALLRVAREKLQLLSADDDLPRPRLVCADMRRLPFADAAFTVLASFFTSFGYFAENADHELAALEMARVLEAGGRFSLDLMNPDLTIRELVPHSTREAAGRRVEETRRYVAATQRIEKRIELIDETTGERRDYFESVRVFTLEDIRALLERAGLEIEEAVGDFDGRVFDENSPRLLLLGRKRGTRHSRTAHWTAERLPSEPAARRTGSPPNDLAANPLRLVTLPREPHELTGERPTRARLLEAWREGYALHELTWPAAARASLESLESPESRIVITGQQAGFLGGPLLTLFKALSAIAAARQASERWGCACVPVFWIASEDHDLDEVRSAAFPDPGSETGLRRFALDWTADRRPIADYRLDEADDRVLAEVLEHFRDAPHAAEVAKLVAAYRGRDLARGFAAFLSELLGPLGLLVVEPRWLRPFARPLLERVLADPGRVLAAVEDGHSELAARGVRAQVSARFPLFLLEPREGSAPARQHLELNESGGLRVSGGGKDYELAALRELLRTSPERFSPAALLRPLVQDAVLPVAFSVGGPAELRYFEQIPPLAKALGRPAPRIAPRFSATFLDPRARRALERLGGPAALASRPRSAADLLPPVESSLLDRTTELERQLEELLGAIVGETALDEAGQRHVLRPARKTRESAARLRERLDRELRRSRTDLEPGAERVWRQAFPGGTLQERSTGTLHWIAQHGSGWLEELLQVVAEDLFRDEHRLLTPRASSGTGERNAVRARRVWR